MNRFEFTLNYGMVGVIQVGAPTNLKEAQEVAKTETAKMTMNKDRFEKELKKIKQ